MNWAGSYLLKQALAEIAELTPGTPSRAQFQGPYTAVPNSLSDLPSRITDYKKLGPPIDPWKGFSHDVLQTAVMGLATMPRGQAKPTVAPTTKPTLATPRPRIK